MKTFSSTHKGAAYAATEAVAYYLLSDMGFDDKTPEGYAQSAASDAEPAPADLQAFQELLEKHQVDLLVNNVQEASDATNLLTGTAQKSDVPVFDVTEQMPADQSSLTSWILSLVTSLTETMATTDAEDDSSENATSSPSESSESADGGAAAGSRQITPQTHSKARLKDGASRDHYGKHPLLLRMVVNTVCHDTNGNDIIKELFMHDGTDSPDGQAPQAAIVFKDACVKRGGRVIWRHGSFSIPSGSVTAIVGTNGAGKTTMMKAELGLIDTTAGSITVLGKPAGVMNQHIGYVPQSYAVDIESNLTAEQSVLLGLTGTRFGIHPVTRAQREKARKAMEFVGLLDKASYRLSELSGGLRQRAAIAQALVSDPQLLMLDEPLANLDLASQRATVHVLAKLNRELGMTIQVVAHDLNMLLPILTGAVYLLDGHPHYARMNEVLDSELLTHLYGTTVQVVTTPQGDMFVTPSDDEPRNAIVDAHDPKEVAQFHQHTGKRQHA